MSLNAISPQEQRISSATESPRPCVAKTAIVDKPQVAAAYMATPKMQADHRMTMMNVDAGHKMTIAKMRREIEAFIVGKAAF
jgi:hypothetical protein